MANLTDVYNQIASKDVELEKQAAELVKEAEEQDAAGRIMARGFADELAKLAEFRSAGPRGGPMYQQNSSLADRAWSNPNYRADTKPMSMMTAAKEQDDKYLKPGSDQFRDLKDFTAPKTAPKTGPKPAATPAPAVASAAKPPKV